MNDAGGGASATPPKFSVALWREQQDEEKRKKEEAARLKAQQGRLRRIETQLEAKALPTSNLQAPSPVFKERVAQVKNQLGARMSPNIKTPEAADPKVVNLSQDPVTQYMALERAWGKDRVSQRLEAINNMWKTANGDYNGSQVVWELTRSPYSLDEIKNMVDESHYILYGPPSKSLYVRGESVEELRVRMKDKYNLRSTAWQAMEEVFRGQQAAELPNSWDTDPVTTALVLSCLIPNPIGAAGLAARIGVFGLKAAKLMGVGVVGIGAANDVLTGDMRSDLDERMAKGEQMLAMASSPLAVAYDSPFKTSLADHAPEPYQQLKALREGMMTWNAKPDSREDIIAIQKAWQEDGIGADLVPEGFFTPEWQSAVLEGAQTVVRLTYEEQRAAIEDGDAPFWAPINGDPHWRNTPAPDAERKGELASAVGTMHGAAAPTVTAERKETSADGWPEWFAFRDARKAEDAKRQAENPDRYAFWNMTGIPRTPMQLQAFSNRLMRNGWLQAMFGAPLQAAMTVGQTYQAAGSALNLLARQRSDPTYQTYLKAAEQYVKEQPFQPNAYYDQMPEYMNEAFIRTAVTVGHLKDDLQAKKWVAYLDQRQNQLIEERYAPDYLLTTLYGAGMDYDGVRQIGLDHPDLVRAFTVGADAIVAYANPVGRVLRPHLKPTVEPGNIGSWNTNWRAWRDVERVSENLASGNGGAAQRVMGGGAAKEVTNSLYRVTAKADGTTGVDYRSRIVQDMAGEIYDVVQAGRPQDVINLMRGASNDAIDAVVNAAQNASANARIPAVGTTASFRQAEVTVVAKVLAKRQGQFKDAITAPTLASRLDPILGSMFVNGANLFPWLRNNMVSAPKQIVESMQKHIADLPDDYVRGVLTRTVLPFITRAPVGEVAFNNMNTLNRVYDAALTVSQDAAWANTFRNRWAAAKTNVQYKALITDLDTMFTAKFKTKKPMFENPLENIVGTVDASGGQALAPNPLGNTPGSRAYEAKNTQKWTDVTGVERVLNESRPAFLTNYLSTDRAGNVVYRQAVPDTVYQQYAASVHRAALWAPYNPKYAAGVAGQMALQAKNALFRYPVQALHRVSTPMRQWTVAMGAPMLFTKHAITDTSRTVLEQGPLALLYSFGKNSQWSKELDEVMANWSPETRNYVQYNKSQAHASESQWLSGNRILKYMPKTIWRDGKLNNLEGSASALMTLTRGKAFTVWSSGGESALRTWLDTAEGKTFLTEGSWGGLRKALDEEHQIALDEGVTLTQRPGELTAADEFVASIMRGEWERLELALPDIMPALKDMAVNNQMLTPRAVQDLIKNNPTNNAVLSSPVEKWEGSSVAGNIVAHAMYPNKFNRDVVFDSTFMREYESQVKAGIDPNDAAKVASDVASLNVARVHFDLANATALEARHRWLAWFATKHRLYGTYVVKTALERPSLAAIAPEIRDWMEERNKDKGMSEYDKYDFVLNLGGRLMGSFNIAPIFWFSEFPMSSSIAIGLERTAEWVAEGPLGLNVPSALKPTPAPFGLSVTRADALFYTVKDIMYSKDVVDDPTLTEWLKTLPENRRLQWNRLITNQRAVAAQKGETIDAYQAFNRAKMSAWISEAWTAFKVYSGKVYGAPLGFPGAKPAEELDIERLQRDLANETDEDKALQMIRDNPGLSTSLNASMDPVEKQALDEGYRVFNAAYDEYKRALAQADLNGNLMSEWKNINKKFNDAIEVMTNPAYEGKPIDGLAYNETFAKNFGSYNAKGFRDALGLIMPLVPTDSVWALGATKTVLEKSKYREEQLQSAFESILAENGLQDSSIDRNLLLYQMIEDEYITKPMAEWTGEDPYSLMPYRAQSVARMLARIDGGTGPYREQKFTDIASEQTFWQWMSAGIGPTGKAMSSKPMMAYLSAMKQDAMGWNVDPAARQDWVTYAKNEAAVEMWRRAQVNAETGAKGIDKSSNAYKQKYAQVMGPVVQELSKSKNWKNEYAFSQLRLDERLVAFGVGTGTSEEDKGMGQFLSITAGMWEELGHEPNPSNKKQLGVGPSSQTGAPIVQSALIKVAQLAKDNPRWWSMFKGTVSLSKFGYVTDWPLTLKKYPEYQFLYTDQEPNSTEEEEDNFWIEGGRLK